LVTASVAVIGLALIPGASQALSINPTQPANGARFTTVKTSYQPYFRSIDFSFQIPAGQFESLPPLSYIGQVVGIQYSIRASDLNGFGSSSGSAQGSTAYCDGNGPEDGTITCSTSGRSFQAGTYYWRPYVGVMPYYEQFLGPISSFTVVDPPTSGGGGGATGGGTDPGPIFMSTGSARSLAKQITRSVLKSRPTTVQCARLGYSKFRCRTLSVRGRKAYALLFEVKWVRDRLGRIGEYRIIASQRIR
jgi:hypothetical protein